jgi:hypothetical protein
LKNVLHIRNLIAATLVAVFLVCVPMASNAGNTLSVLYSSGSNSFSVVVSGADLIADKIVVMSLIGRKMKEQQYVKGQDIYKFYDMSDFPNGIYLVLVKDKNDKIIDTAKLIINK